MQRPGFQFVGGGTCGGQRAAIVAAFLLLRRGYGDVDLAWTTARADAVSRLRPAADRRRAGVCDQQLGTLGEAADHWHWTIDPRDPGLRAVVKNAVAATG